MRLLFAALAIAIPFFGVIDARAASVTRSYSYFSIGGTTMQDLQQELVARGPMVQSSGQRHAGATQMRFVDKVRFSQAGGKCRISSASVTVKARIILPRWTRRGSGSDETRLIWDTLSADIKRHEENHVSIARRHAREMELALLAMPPQRDCAAVTVKGREAMAQQMKRHDAEQARFDVIEGRNFGKRLDRLIRLRVENGRTAGPD